MKKLNTLIAIVAAAALANAGTTEQTVTNNGDFNVDVTTAYASDKVWRGTDLGQNEAVGVVSTSFELPAEVGLDLSAEYGLVDSTNASEEATDLTAVFSKSVADYLLSLSYTWYSEGLDQSGVDQAQEVGLSVSREVGPVTLTLTQYLGVEGDNNGYSELKSVYTSDFGVLPVLLDFTGEVGYLAQDNKFTHLEARVSTDLPVTEEIVAQPFVAYNVELGESFVAGEESNDVFFGGVQFKRSF